MRRPLLACTLVAVSGALLVAQAPPRPQPGTKLSLDELKAQMFHVSAGRRLKPKSWPNGARVAVGLSFDVDNASASLATGDLISESISRGEYGAVDGLPRILRLLDNGEILGALVLGVPVAVPVGALGRGILAWPLPGRRLHVVDDRSHVDHRPRRIALALPNRLANRR